MAKTISELEKEIRELRSEVKEDREFQERWRKEKARFEEQGRRCQAVANELLRRSEESRIRSQDCLALLRMLGYAPPATGRE